MWGRKKEVIYKPYNFDDDFEFLIYRNACGQKLNKKEKKKIRGYEFGTYQEWKDYVVNKYDKVSLKSLYDVQRFLKNRRRMEHSFSGAYIGILTPWMCMMLTITMGSIFSWTNGGMIVMLIVNIIIGALLLSPLCHVFWDYFMQTKKEVMIEDYEEIIKNMIGEKEACFYKPG